METVQASLTETDEVLTCETHGEYSVKLLKLFRTERRLTACPSCQQIEREKEEKERAERDAADNQRRLDNRLDQAGIPLLLRNRSFESYEADTDAKQNALNKFVSFIENFKAHCKTGTVLVAMGRVGTGKSHLAIACGNEIIRRGGTALYISTARLFTKIRGTWAKSSEMSEEQMLKHLELIDLMILDEVGLQRGTEDEQRTLHEILEARRLNCRPTIILTNLDGAALKGYLGERFVDRLSESGVSVMFDWESHRRQSRDVAGLDLLGAK